MAAWCFLNVFTILVLFASPTWTEIAEELSDSVIDQCKKVCPLKNRTDENGNEYVTKCIDGCKLWNKALPSSCDTICNATTTHIMQSDLFCVMGCNEALNSYYQILKVKIGIPPAPALVADSVTATSLWLSWDGERHSNLSYLVQWHYEELSGAWQYCRNQTWGENSTVFVQNLQPYTKYRFRVAILPSKHHTDPIVSLPSLEIITASLGIPTSAPVNLRVAIVDPHRISVSWEQGPFPNGPILSYVLTISEVGRNEKAAVKDISASNKSLFYMFQSLKPSTMYTVSIAMCNSFGEGPRETVNATTLDSPKAVASQQLTAILTNQHTINLIKDELSELGTMIYNTSFQIEGVGIDISEDILFISDSNGSVIKTTLSKGGVGEIVFNSSMVSYKPLDLSVDWLNKYLYILGEINHSKLASREGNNSRWQIFRCDYEGRSPMVAYGGFNSRPIHIEVDPYNGYLFWVLGKINGGLYRLDLADISNGVRHEVTPSIILRDPNLGAFAIDHTNFRILIPHSTNNSMLSVSLNGQDIVDLRNNTQTKKFNSVKSISFYNGLFYWSDGTTLYSEEVNGGMYYQSRFAREEGNFSNLLVTLPESQPIPIAVNPPVELQSVMGTNHAKINWQPPHLLGHQGVGAWQQWRYNLQITDLENNSTIHRKNIDKVTYTLKDLKENTIYIIKAAAVTLSGTGPWSSEFIAKTLSPSENGVNSSLLWSTHDGLLQSDLTGDNIVTLIDQSHLNESHIIDIAWYRDQLYLVTSASTVLKYNTTSRKKEWMQNMNNVGSLAVDWIGEKLYWASPKQQLITRSDLKGTSHEPVPIVTIGKELKIDSVGGFLYWNTGHAIECARLNGENRIPYHPADVYKQQVMGLTVDLKGKVLYWIILGYEESNLYKAPTADTFTSTTQISGELISSLSKSAAHGPLYYFSERLIWLQDDKHAIISDVNGQNKAKLNSSFMNNVHTIAVVDPNLEIIPDGNEMINVIPEPVDETSIKIIGNYDIFNVTWEHLSRVNYGILFYDVKVEYNGTKLIELITNNSYVQYNKKVIPPFSVLEMSIRPYTYWGSAPITRTFLKSPQAPPTKPQNPRVFILHQNNLDEDENNITAVFRWNKPKYLNGEIIKYEVYCWYEKNGSRNPFCGKEQVMPHQLQYVIDNAPQNVTFYFQISAYTDGGISPATDPVSARTDVESPIPILAISNHESIRIVDLDIGNYSVCTNSSKPLDFTVNIREGSIYWLNDMKEIFVSKIGNIEHKKLLSLNGTGLSIAVDWVSRILYWSQSEYSSDRHGYAIYQFDLNAYEIAGIKRQKFVLFSQFHIHSLQVSPLTKSLYWIEMINQIQGGLYKANYDESNFGLLYNYQHSNNLFRENSHDENICPEHAPVRRGYTLDFSQREHFKIYWSHSRYNHIFVSDIDVRRCEMFVNSTQPKAHLPPHYITVDSENLYWSDLSDKKIYYKNKNSVEIKSVHHHIKADHKMLAIGNNIQPYPPKHCLTPKKIPLNLKLINRTSESLTLELPEPIKSHNCEEYDLATPFYIVYYKRIIDNEDTTCDNNSCSSEITFDRLFHLNNLNPFSKYMFYVQISNYYDNITYFTPDLFAKPDIFKTKAKAPPPVQNLTAFVLSPTQAEVEWHTPFLGDDDDVDIRYEIYWITQGFLPNEKVKTESKDYPISDSTQPSVMSTLLTKLIPSQEYRIWVETHSNNSDEYSKSETVFFKTYPEPNNITLNFNSPYEIRISWTPYKEIQINRFAVEFAEIISNDWREVKNNGSESSDGSIEYVIPDLSPKTFYKFRLRITYRDNLSPYYWPSDSRFAIETPGDRPSPPGKPTIQILSALVYQLQWQPSIPRGSPIIMYIVYGRICFSKDAKVRINRNVKMDSSFMDEEVLSRALREANNSQFQADIPYSSIDESMLLKNADNESVEDEWEMLYNGTENYWIIPEMKLNKRYEFKIQAENLNGLSDFSKESDEFDFSVAFSERMDISAIVLGIIISLVLVVFIGIALCAWFFKKKNEKTTMIKSLPFNGSVRVDVELANLRELPRSRGGGGMFQHSTNILYNNGSCNPPTDAEIASLPHIRRDQITLTKFLGSGAFGEVFEGKAKDLENSGSETRVAIKTLRKGATDQEKTEFLQEAQLMSNFKHDHILSMLGVCLDNDPHFIIMELMEGGDLLSYLRARRPMHYKNDSLTLQDLLSMCMDVTKGCRYLEEMHFVHRDLACRNCLVTQQVNGRIVKIGDFGLARDIYKNDYYRKEGEGLLPVRWMAVECLTDGVFSRASDVWAWAVLCWEVTALGRQPYSALPNQSVMRYVCSGGTLQRPTNCPIPLFLLLQKCWSYNPDHRPTFKYCLEILEELITHIDEDAPLVGTIEEEPQYITVIPDAKAVSNRLYFMDENQNDECSGHLNVVNQETPVRTPIQNPVVIQPPKYLELLYDGDTPIICSDGYEVPRSSIRSNISRNTIDAEAKKSNEDVARTSNNKFLNSDESNKESVLEIINDIKCNGCAPNIIFGSISENENELSSLQKLIPNSVDSLVRKNSIVSHSDDEKLSRNKSETVSKLMNGNGFVKNNFIVNLGCNMDSTSRTSC